VRLIRTHKYLFLRRLLQVTLLLLFVAGNAFSWVVLQGNFSSSRLFGFIPLADPFALLQIMATGTMISAQALLGGGIILLFFAFVAGRAFCGWICPVNMVTDLANVTGHRIFGPALTRKMSRNARYWVTGLSLALSALLGVAAFEWISPINALHRGVIYGMGMGWTLIAAVFLFDALIVRNGFCGHLCPLGAFYALIGRARALRVMHVRERCTSCMLCLENCPEPQVLSLVGNHSGAVASGECSNCGKCIDVCPEQAMRFGFRYYSATDTAGKEALS
jgi:ferredoxin-type protein NapH